MKWNGDALKCRSPTSGFTLIELLVVVAIVGILFGMILPSVGQVKSKARWVGCMSNMRQLGIGIMMHSDDQGGTLPIATDFSLEKTSNHRIWVTPISKYIRGRDVFLCPSAKTASRFESQWSGRGWISIGYNGVTAYDPRAIEGPAQKPSINEVAEPVRTVLFADTPSGPTEEKYRGYVFSPFNGLRNRLDPKLSTPLIADHDLVFGSDLKPSELKPVFARHSSNANEQGRTNLMLGDGHVESQVPREILRQDSGSGLIWAYR